MSVILSYSAGSSSTDPYGFRVIDSSTSASRASGLCSAFPMLAESLGEPDNVLMINAYPATLGGLSQFRSVDTYMHPPTMLRAMRLAAIESKRVVFAAQPLLGADLLLRASRQCQEFPSRILWATGGYPLPQSLEHAVRTWLSERSCELQILHAYGVAELDHTLMAAMQRDHQGRLIYHAVHPHLQWQTNGWDPREVTTLQIKNREIQCTDDIVQQGESFRIGGDPTRFSNEVTAILESWSVAKWADRTGYVAWFRDRLCVQRRNVHFREPSIATEDWILRFPVHRADRPDASTIRPIPFHTFAGRFAMSWQQKPVWKTASIRHVGIRYFDQSVKAAAA